MSAEHALSRLVCPDDEHLLRSAAPGRLCCPACNRGFYPDGTPVEPASPNAVAADDQAKCALALDAAIAGVFRAAVANPEGQCAGTAQAVLQALDEVGYHLVDTTSDPATASYAFNAVMAKIGEVGGLLTLRHYANPGRALAYRWACDIATPDGSTIKLAETPDVALMLAADDLGLLEPCPEDVRKRISERVLAETLGGAESFGGPLP